MWKMGGRRVSKFINIGFFNYVNACKVVAIKKYGSLPVKRCVENAREQGTLIDCTEGRKTLSAIFMVNGMIVTSCKVSQTLAERMEDKNGD
jgi:regulator of extracellular matrix RemA (YlzA/DUF370 family)